MIKRFTAALLIALMAFGLFACKKEQEEAAPGFFEQTRWGMSPAEVNDSTERELAAAKNGSLICKSVDEVEFFDKSVGTAKSISYFFDDESLVQVQIIAEPSDSGSTTVTNGAAELRDAVNTHLGRSYKPDEKNSDGQTTRWTAENGTATVTAFNSKIIITLEEK